MLHACTIDGFGWFRTGDLRRAFLLFDEIDHVFPDKEVGDIWYPPAVLQHPGYRARRVALNSVVDHVHRLVDAAVADPSFRALVTRVPEDDQQYALAVARTDPELLLLVRPHDRFEPVAAIAALIAKLLAYASRTNTVPVVGKAYAYPLLRRTLELSHGLTPTNLAPARPGTPAAPRPRITIGALAAGLSLEWIASDSLEQISFAAMREFKQRHASLLLQHQAHLVESAQAFHALPDGPEFAERLASLRLAAREQRAALDEASRAALQALGVTPARPTTPPGPAAIPVIAAIRGPGLSELLAIPGVITGAGMVIKNVLEAAERPHQAAPPALAYVFEGQGLLEPAD